MDNGKKLEHYKLFPIVAWAVFIGFTIFVYSLAMQLQSVSTSLQATSVSFDSINERVLSNEERIEALEAAQAEQDTTE